VGKGFFLGGLREWGGLGKGLPIFTRVKVSQDLMFPKGGFALPKIVGGRFFSPIGVGVLPHTKGFLKLGFL